MLEIQKKLSNVFYGLLSLPSTAMGFALSIQISALSWIMSFKYHLNIEEVGIVWAAGPLAGIFGQVIIGLISDKVWFWGGRRRPFVLIGGTLAAIMLIALPNIDKIQTFFGISDLIIVAVFVALTLDMAINISFNPTRSIIADATPEGEKRTKGYTWMQTISGTFGMLAYAIGANWGNITLIYIGSFIVFFFSIVPMFFIEEKKDLSEGEPESSNKKRDFTIIDIIKTVEPLSGFLFIAIYYFFVKIININIPDSVSNWIFIILTCYQLFLTLRILLKSESTGDAVADNLTGYKKALSANAYAWVGIQTMFVFTYAFIRKEFFPGDNLTESQTAEIGSIISYSFLILNAVGAVLPALVLEPQAKKFGKIKVHGTAVGIMSVAYALMALFAGSPTMLWIFMGIAGIGWAAVVSLPFAIMSEKVDKNRMGLYMGIFNLSIVFPQLFVSWGLSKLISVYPEKIYIFSFVALAISSVLWLFIKDKQITKN